MNDFRDRLKGQYANLTAEELNAMLDAGAAFKRGELRPVRAGAGVAAEDFFTPASVVSVYNTTGGTLPSLAILTPSGAALDPDTDDISDRKGARQPVLNVSAPVTEDDPVLIAFESIPDDARGRAVAAGVTVARVDITDITHRFARPIVGNIFQLQSAETGQVLLLTPPGSTGVVKTYVQLGGGGDGLTISGTDHRVVRMDGTDEIQDSDATLDDDGNFITPGYVATQDELDLSGGPPGVPTGAAILHANALRLGGGDADVFLGQYITGGVNHFGLLTFDFAGSGRQFQLSVVDGGNTTIQIPNATGNLILFGNSVTGTPAYAIIHNTTTYTGDTGTLGPGAVATGGIITDVGSGSFATGGGTATGTNTGDQNLFSTIAVSGQSNVVADATSDTLTLVAGSNITITTNATTDTITINSTAAGVSDGDYGGIIVTSSGAVWYVADGNYGDVVVSDSGNLWTIDTNAVDDTKLRDSVANSVIGRSANSAGDPADIQAITDGTVLRLSGTTLGFGAVALANTNATTGQLLLSRGGTGADLSATGGTGQYLKQSSAGATITVGTIPAADLPAASDTAQGAIEIAVQSEMETGSDTTRAVTPGRQHYHQSAAKAWVSIDGTGTVGIRASYNVSSITDNGAGDYTVNFTTAFSSADYGFSVVTGRGASAATGLLCLAPDQANPTASAFRLVTISSVFAAADAEYVGACFFGDQ